MSTTDHDHHDDHGHDHDHSHADHDHGHEHGGGVWGWLKSVFAPHSHDTGEQIQSALDATSEGLRTLKLSLVVLGITAVLQLVIVIVSGSIALLADTIHNLGDALTAVPLGVAFWLSRRPANKRYTYGYGRAEDLAGIAIVVTIAASSVIAGIEALNRLFHPQDVHHLPWVAAAGVVGFLGNESVAVYRIRTGRRIGSAALVADGLHARTDGLTSLAVVFGALGTAVGWRYADPIVGLLITIAILGIVRNAARDVLRRLLDSVDPGLVQDIEVALASVGGVTHVERVRVRWVGHELHAEAEIVAAADLSLVDGHRIAHDAEHELLHAIPRLSSALVHTSPEGSRPHNEPHSH